MTRARSGRFMRGVTLIELIVTITVIALAGSALLGTLAYLNGTGNLSILQVQAQSIANAYLNRITSKPFNDVDDFNGLVDPVALDVAGNASGNFRVSVAVVAGGLGALPAADVWRVNVTVAYGNGHTAIATGYRTQY